MHTNSVMIFKMLSLKKKDKGENALRVLQVDICFFLHHCLQEQNKKKSKYKICIEKCGSSSCLVILSETDPSALSFNDVLLYVLEDLKHYKFYLKLFCRHRLYYQHFHFRQSPIILKNILCDLKEIKLW